MNITARRYARVTTGTVIALTFCVATMLLFGFAYLFRAHLHWKAVATFVLSEEAPPIDVQPMPRTEVPEDWIRCEAGGVVLYLPPDLAEGRQRPSHPGAAYEFASGQRLVAVMPPGPVVWPPPYEHLENEDGSYVTAPQFFAAVHAADSDDFRWSMASEEVHRLTALVMVRQWAVSDLQSPVECDFREDMDGLLSIYNERSAGFEWEHRECKVLGTIMFQDDAGLDRTWVRTMCHSVRFSCGGDRAGAQNE